MPTALVRAGAWLFARRGWLPVPLAVLCLAFPTRGGVLGWAVMGVGEAVRLWAVGHIGLPSRTREEGIGPLVDTGPYSRVRNPLYLGNLLLWSGLGVVQWPAVLLAAPLMMGFYTAIVAWEVARWDAEGGEAFRAYRARVPRWIPLGPPRAGAGWSLRRALRTERGTLVVITVVLAAVAVRARLG